MQFIFPVWCKKYTPVVMCKINRIQYHLLLLLLIGVGLLRLWWAVVSLLNMLNYELRLHKHKKNIHCASNSVGSFHRCCFFPVCMCLTYVDSPAVALHQQQRKDVQRNQVDNKNVTSPRWHLQQACMERAHQEDLSFQGLSAEVTKHKQRRACTIIPHARWSPIVELRRHSNTSLMLLNKWLLQNL